MAEGGVRIVEYIYLARNPEGGGGRRLSLRFPPCSGTSSKSEVCEIWCEKGGLVLAMTSGHKLMRREMMLQSQAAVMNAQERTLPLPSPNNRCSLLQSEHLGRTGSDGGHLAAQLCLKHLGYVHKEFSSLG